MSISKEARSEERLTLTTSVKPFPMMTDLRLMGARVLFFLASLLFW